MKLKIFLKKRMKNKIILIFLLLTSCPAYAGLQAGFSTNYLKINDNYSRNYRFAPPIFNLGYSYNIQALVISATTNRLFNQSVEQQVVSKTNGLAFTSRTKIIADSLIIGYPVKRIIPAIVISNVGVKKSLYRDNKFLGKTEQHAILGGICLTYIYDKDLSLFTTLIAPNKRFNLDYGVSMGINYNFNIL